MIERELSFDTQSHSVDAVQRAVYRFSDRLSAETRTAGADIRCRVFIQSDSDDEAEAILGDFRNEVIDQVLRERIRGETEAVRNAILALAFASTGLVPSE